MAKGKKQSEKEAKITEGTKIDEALQSCPEAAGIMMKYGMHCVGCHVAADETIKQGALVHGMSETDLKKMMSEINKLAKKRRP